MRGGERGEGRGKRERGEGERGERRKCGIRVDTVNAFQKRISQGRKGNPK